MLDTRWTRRGGVIRRLPEAEALVRWYPRDSLGWGGIYLSDDAILCMPEYRRLVADWTLGTYQGGHVQVFAVDLR